MSNLHKCSACGGVYVDPQPDGSAYFHACPFVANKAFQPDPTLPNYDPREVVRPSDARDENLLPAVQLREGVHVVVTRDPNDTQVEIVTPVADTAKQPGAGRVAVDKRG